MKKGFSIALLLIYLCFNTGLAVHIHYCGGKASSFSLFADGPKSCTCGKNKMAKSCCKDTKETLEVDDSQQIPNHTIVYPDFITYLPSTVETNVSSFPESHSIVVFTNTFYIFDTGPPKIPLYIQFSSLII